MDFQYTSFILSVVIASTPLLLAATGELVAERAGVLNLGVEGMMLVGAIAAFAVAVTTGSSTLGILAGVGAGVLTSLIFALLTLSFLSNQVATGLALTIFGTGLSALIGKAYVGMVVARLPQIHIPGLSDIPFFGPVFFGQDVLVYVSFALVAAVYWFLFRTHAGLVLRAVGDSHDAAHAIGFPVIKIRYLAVMFGGGMSGLAGAYMAIAYNTSWSEGMTAGRGWIALALVVFATWRPFWLVVGAYLFGSIMYLSLYIQGFGVHIPSQFISALPYASTVVVLVAISRDRKRIRLNAPASLGKTFHAAG
ncbi:MAG: ABC transporter permease [Parvibaculum sedimenti]|uniref:ABC transporter permease n=1 Tax=Parvibaculum sedimenti TaxID=2608632 RepID=UPI003BB4C480